MSKRFFAVTVAVAGGLLALGLGAGPAFAGGTPNPHPTPTYTMRECPPGFVLQDGRCVPVVVNPQLRQQEFDIQDANALPNGWVLGTGPINITGGIDKSTSNPRVDLLDTADGVSGVRINHEPLSGAVIDRTTCSIKYDQVDLPWSIHQGFGRFLGATGNGVYDLVGLFSFPTRNNFCTLPVYLTSSQADRDLNAGGIGLPAPLAVSVDVQAVGRAAVVPHVTPPVPCPTRTYFAPVTPSTTAYLGNGDNCQTVAPA
jgi:hypothetical protein